MIFIVSKYLIPKGYTGLTFFPFVILKYKSSKNDLITINHEKIHIRQQLELLILPFYVWYFGNLFYNYLKYRNFQKAYRNIIFEREAYANETHLNYLKSRSFWRFLKYL
ncbi:hypothetical protein [Flavobacterium sp.]|uniref:hypothetical protein n=1 Tax=Flavobacterium sp. TaxID=239 RepID=UPI003751A563